MRREMCVSISIASKTRVYHPEVRRYDAAGRQMVGAQQWPLRHPVGQQSSLSAVYLSISISTTDKFRTERGDEWCCRERHVLQGTLGLLDWWRSHCFTWLAAWNRCWHKWDGVENKVSEQNFYEFLHSLPIVAEHQWDFFFHSYPLSGLFIDQVGVIDLKNVLNHTQ